MKGLSGAIVRIRVDPEGSWHGQANYGFLTPTEAIATATKASNARS